MLTLLGGSTGAHDMRNPINNFIFEYYHISNKKTLLEYGPGVGDGEPATPTAFLLPTHTNPNTDTDAAADAATDAIRLLAGKAVAVTGLPGVDPREATAVMWVPPPLGSKGWTEKHVKALRFGREVLRASAGRAPIFYCYGGALQLSIDVSIDVCVGQSCQSSAPSRV